MIPTSFLRIDVLEALRRIDRDGVPLDRSAKKFVLVHRGKHYPPKYVSAVASQLASGSELSPDADWGPETNGRLRRLGFTIGLGAG